MSWFRVFLGLVVPIVSIAFPSPGRAESPPHSVLIQPGRDLRVSWHGNRVEGPFERFAADTLWLRAKDQPGSVPIAADSIRGVWVRGNAAGKGALIGGIAGFGLGLVAGAGIAEGFEGEDDDAEFTLISGLAGCAGGALLGALIGYPITRWHQRWPRRH